MAEVTMSQNINILLLSLARACPGGRVNVVAVGPLAIRNGQVESVGAVTKTEIQLSDISRKELSLPVPLAELQANAAHKLAKRANHMGGRPKR
jgi:hypothetical protein